MSEFDNSEPGAAKGLADSEDALARQQVIADRLRELFNHVLEEEVPDEFAQLLDRLGREPSGPETPPQPGPEPAPPVASMGEETP